MLVFALIVGLFADCVCAQSTGLDPSFNVGAGANGTIKSVVVQNDGKVVIAGDFTMAGNLPRTRVARLNADGSLDTTFNPGVGPNAIVRSVMVQTDGKIVIGGDFTSVAGTTRNRLARLTATGSLDTDFLSSPTQGANGPVHVVANFKGLILVGGEFTSFSGNPNYPYVVFIEPDSGQLLGFFGARLNGPVFAIAPIPNEGRVYLGGAFTTANNGLSCPHLGRFSDSGGMDASFNPGTGFNGNVTALAIDLPGNRGVYAAGNFTTVDGQAHQKLAYLFQSGSVSPGFNSGAGPNGSINTLAVRNDDNQLTVGGSFASYNGVPVSNIAEVNGQTGSILVSSVGANGAVHTMANQSDGKVFVGGEFTAIQATSVWRIARLYGPNGAAPPDAPPWLNVAQATDTQLILTWGGVSYLTGYKIERSLGESGVWTQIATPSSTAPFLDGGLSSNTVYNYRIRAYSTNGDGSYSPIGSATTLAGPWALAGARDSAFGTAIGTGANSVVSASAIQSDGKVLLGGSFGTFNSVSHRGIVRLNADGSTDTTFTTLVESIVESVAVQPDGKILIGGSFIRVNNIPRAKVARLHANGSLDTSFDPGTGPNNSIKSLATQADGKVVLSGNFTTINGIPRNGIARLNADGTLDTTFNPGTGLSFANGYTLALQPDGKVIVGGFFQSAAGVSRGNLARLNPDGSVDPTFATGAGANSWIEELFLQSDGRIMIVGAFSSYDGVVRKGVARLFSDGTLDPAFVPDFGAEYGWPKSIAVQSDGKVIIGGWFTMVNRFGRFRLARLNPDGTLDATFQPGIGASSDVVTLTLQPDGRCIAGGWFSSYNGISASYVTRLLGDSGNALTPFDQWKIDQGLAASTSDTYDLEPDGIPLLLEYALGLNPMASDTEGLPTALLDGSSAQISYNRVRSDVTYLVESSTDMQNWTTGGVNQGTPGPTVTATVSIDSAFRMFLRLRISR